VGGGGVGGFGGGGPPPLFTIACRPPVQWRRRGCSVVHRRRHHRLADDLRNRRLLISASRICRADDRACQLCCWKPLAAPRAGTVSMFAPFRGLCLAAANPLAVRRWSATVRSRPGLRCPMFPLTGCSCMLRPRGISPASPIGWWGCFSRLSGAQVRCRFALLVAVSSLGGIQRPRLAKLLAHCGSPAWSPWSSASPIMLL